MNMFKILVAEDDEQLCQLFCRVLKRNGFTAVAASDGQDALEKMEQEYVDLIVSDIMMPRVDGYGLLRTLRESGSSIPVLMITARDSFQDMQHGFLSGADDYMVKPINVNELVLRIHALLRRSQMVAQRQLQIGGSTLTYDALSVKRGAEEVFLPQKEFQLLYKLISSPGQIFSRQQLMDDIWGYDNESDTHTVDVHIGRLRERFRHNNDFKIVTMRGVGYKVVKQ